MNKILGYYLEKIYGSREVRLVQKLLDDIGVEISFLDFSGDDFIYALDGRTQSHSINYLIHNAIVNYINSLPSLIIKFKVGRTLNYGIVSSVSGGDVFVTDLNGEKHTSEYIRGILDTERDEVYELIKKPDNSTEFNKLYKDIFEESTNIEQYRQKIVEEIMWLDNNTNGVTFEGSKIKVRTKDITIKRLDGPQTLNIGNFYIEMDFSRTDWGGRVYRYKKDDGKCHHPHVGDSGSFCTGSFEEPLRAARRTKDLTVIYTIIVEFLSNYNGDSPYDSMNWASMERMKFYGDKD